MNQQEEEKQKEDSKWKKCFKIMFLKKWHPKPSVNHTILLFSIVGVIFIIIGAIIASFNSSIVELTIPRYETSCQLNQLCTLTFTVPQTMTQPIFLFYNIENFYQNHRRYMKSKSATQLAGTEITVDAATTACDPMITNENMQKAVAWDNKTPLAPASVASPCGLIAKSFFNDNYTLQIDEASQTNILINETGIAWADDIGDKFKRSINSQQTQWIDPQNEHFIVWMRTSGLPDFRKLWGRIQTNLNPNTNYKFIVQNNYDVKAFDGHKSLILSTSGPLGGKNIFLSAAFFVVGFLCLIICVIFYAKKKSTGDQFGKRD